MKYYREVSNLRLEEEENPMLFLWEADSPSKSSSAWVYEQAIDNFCSWDERLYWLNHVLSLGPRSQFSIHRYYWFSLIDPVLIAYFSNFFQTFFQPFSNFFSTFFQLFFNFFQSFFLTFFQLALVSILATRWRHMHCHIAQDCPIDIISWYRVAILISQSHIS